jgi:hypothetical protein
VRNAFLTGCILPDTGLGSEKRYSHFWNEDMLKYLVRKPDMELFLSKYGDRLDTPLMLGYYAHLRLDLRFIDEYWAEEFRFFDKDMQPETLYEKIAFVRVKHSGETLPIKEFLSEKYYYGDYSKSNEYYIKKYNIVFPERRHYDCCISEVDTEGLGTVYKNLDTYCVGGNYDDIKRLKVFDVEKLDKMIENESNEAAQEIAEKLKYSLQEEVK